MAGRIRSIKPELLEDEVAAGLSDAAWRLFVSSWLLADDGGNFRAGGKYLAAQVWQDTDRDAEAPLRELAKAGRVLVYEVEGQRYGHIPSWARHQRIDNAGKPRVPPPPENLREVSARFAETRRDSRNPPRGLDPTSEFAALPPTSDLRPPKGEDQATAEAAADAAGPATPPPEPIGSDPSPTTSSSAPPPSRTRRRPGAKAKPEAMLTTYPADFAPNAATLEAARRHGFGAARLAFEGEAFRDKAQADGWTAADWQAKFRTWLKNSRGWQDQRGGSPPLGFTEPPPIAPPRGIPPKCPELVAFEAAAAANGQDVAGVDLGELFRSIGQGGAGKVAS